MKLNKIFSFSVCSVSLGVVFSFSAMAQEHQCGSSYTQQKKMMESQPRGELRESYQITQNARGEVLIVAHVFRKKEGNSIFHSISEQHIQSLIDQVNKGFAASAIKFKLEQINYIDREDDTPLNLDYDRDRRQSEFEGMLEGFQEDVRFKHKINVIFAHEVNNLICGMATFPFNRYQGIVIPTNFWLKNGQFTELPLFNFASHCVGHPKEPTGTTLTHELGHFFNLLHTHENFIAAMELVERRECDTRGDFLCDTPADPILSGKNVDDQCRYVGYEVDPEGIAYADAQLFSASKPDPSLFMSYAPNPCKKRFSSEQFEIMKESLQARLTPPSELVSSLKAYPNPIHAGQNLTIEIPFENYKNAEGVYVGIDRIEVVDARGQIVRGLKREKLFLYRSGDHATFTIENPMQNVTAEGVYFVRFTLSVGFSGPEIPKVIKVIYLKR